MEELNKILNQIKELFAAKKYIDIVSLLTDDFLLKSQNDELYFWKSKAYIELNQLDAAIICINNAIKINPDKAWSYGTLGLVYSKKREYNLAIDNYSKSIKLGPNSATSYNNRGLVFQTQGEHDLAIKDFNRAIKLNGKYYRAIHNRGNSWKAKSNSDNAIKDYTRAIEIKPDLAIGYNSRGTVWATKSEYDLAIEDYTKAIEIKPDYFQAINNRGVAWFKKKNYDLALRDYYSALDINRNYAPVYNNIALVLAERNQYNQALEYFEKAITIFPKISLPYTNAGKTYKKIGDINAAIKYFQQALQLNPNDVSAKFNLDQIHAELGESVKLKGNEDDKAFYRIVDVVKELDIEKRDALISYYIQKIDPLIIQVRNCASIITNKYWTDEKGTLQPKRLTHYTNLKTVDALIHKDYENTRNNSTGKLRYSNAVFMNDPQEGQILIEILNNMEDSKEGDHSVKKAFENIQKKESVNFYLGAFLPAIKGHDDELLMWRTYGKDEKNNEAAGCSLVIDYDFFDQSDGKYIVMGEEVDGLPISHSLYRVLYYNLRDKQLTGPDNDEITKCLQDLLLELKILLAKKSLTDTILNETIDKILYHSLSELRYFFKSADYAYENELRVIQFATKEIVKIDDNDSLPRKMYIESTKSVHQHLKKIVLGPKVQHPDRWMYLAEEMKRKGNPIELIRSNCHFQ